MTALLLAATLAHPWWWWLAAAWLWIAAGALVLAVLFGLIMFMGDDMREQSDLEQFKRGVVRLLIVSALFASLIVCGYATSGGCDAHAAPAAVFYTPPPPRARAGVAGEGCGEGGGGGNQALGLALQRLRVRHSPRRGGTLGADAEGAGMNALLIAATLDTLTFTAPWGMR